MVKKGNAVAIRNASSLAALAWARLEQDAQAALKANSSTPALQLVADTQGITAKISDAAGTTVIVQGGKISVTVASQEAE